ncbi:MAG: hypothetical protein P8R54_23460 [Myxococcota bacterium]|nr:hypothetical protein [Myxococcota bacterium]
MPWWKDRQLWMAIAIGTLLRAIPLLVWMDDWGCVRDECTYLGLARRMAAGEGMTSSSGWVWAPGYPFLLAIHKVLFQWGAAIRGTQVVVAAVSAVMLFRISLRGGSVKRARVVAWLYCLSPTMIFFSQSLWSECIYAALLLGGLLIFETARDRLEQVDVRTGLKWGAGLGAMVGCCMLFRGVATYMLPIFGVALLWGRPRRRGAWGQVIALFVVAGLTVAPYSLYATKKFGDTIVTDRTLGQMLWLGNNDFEPITFDWGNGTLSGRAWKRHTAEGRKPCGDKKEALKRDDCQTEAGKQWIKDHPEEFVGRMPKRVAQLLNPHSFITRHLRWGEWRGLPWQVDELIILWNVSWSLLILLGGGLVLAARGKGARGILIAGLLLYHAAAISILAGLTRYRVPLEPLLMLYAAQLISEPRAVLGSIRGWRVLLVGAVMVVLVPLVLWYLPTGWPWWRKW